MIIADAVKGKGVSFMENQAGRHGTATKGAEQNMMSVAAGLALEGKIPITETCGVSVGVDGATHQALEEISLVAIPPGRSRDLPLHRRQGGGGEDLAIVACGWPVPLRQPRGGRPVRGVRQALGVHGKVRIDRGAYRGARVRAERKGGR